MNEYARQRGLRRLLISIPILTPRLSSLWLGLVTPVYARIGRKLIDSIRNETIVKDPSALTLFPFKPVGLGEMVRRATQNEDQEFAMTRWSDALSSCGRRQSWADNGSESHRRCARSADRSAATLGVSRFAASAVQWLVLRKLVVALRGFIDLLLAVLVCAADGVFRTPWS